MDKLKDIIRKKLKEMNATSTGGATAIPGESIGIAAKFAFKKANEGIGADLGPGPKAGPEGVKDNAYIKQFKYRLVPKNPKPKSYDIKKLWEEEKEKTGADKFQDDRIKEFEQIENLIKQLSPLISNAKNETIEYYAANPGSYDIYKPSSMVLAYIQKAVDLLKQKQ